MSGAGRGLFAARDIKAGEVVLRDWPVVEGPLPDGGDEVCVVCLGGDEVKPCPICTLPVCKVSLKKLIIFLKNFMGTFALQSDV